MKQSLSTIRILKLVLKIISHLFPVAWIKKLSKRQKLYLEVAIGGVLVVLIPIILTSLQKPTKASAAWFDDNWLYRQIVAITNTGSAQTDYQVQITVDTQTDLVANGKMQSDCDDIRITDINGRLLPYWLEPTTCNTTTTKIWTKVPSVPAQTSGTTAVVYLYYGNSSASSTSSVAKTFIREITNVQGAWTLDESSGGTGAVTRNDSSSNGSNLTDINTTASTTGKFSNAGQFVRANSERLEIADNASLSAGDIDFSLAQWVYLDTKTGFEIITFKGTGGGADETMEYVVRYNSSDRFIFIVGNGTTSSNVSADALGSPSTGTWYFIVAWHDSVANTINIQVNNGTVNSTSYSGGSQNTNTKFAIGADHAALHHMDGRIDEVRFYKKVLSAEERADLYNNFGYVTTNYANKELVRKRASTEPSAAAPASEENGPGPIGYWAFDDGQGSTAQDSTSSNYDGTITGATWQTEDKCISGKCLFFTSATDRVAAGTSNNLNITSGDATYQTWVKLTAATFLDNNTNWTLFSNESYQASGMIIRIDGGTGKLMYRSNQATASTNFTTTSTPIASNNTWYHIAAVKSGTTISFYVNGNFIQSGTITNPVTTTNAFTIGSAVGGSQSVRGLMDEAKVYNFARTSAQILADYQSGLSNAGTNQGTSAVLGSKTEKWLSDGLVGYWKMDESAANSCTGAVNDSCDSSGNSLDGAWAGTNIAATSGKFSNGVNLNGTDDNISVSDNSNLDIGTGDFSVSVWFTRNTNATTNLRLLSKGAAAQDQKGWAFFGSDTSLTAIIGNGTARISATGTHAGLTVWNHATLVVKRNDKLYLYLNGSLATSADISSYGTTDLGSTYGMFFGRDAADSQLFWPGTIDELRMYNRALSPKEISDLYNWAPGPVGYWNFEEGTGTSAYDTSGNNNTGTLTSNPTWAKGKYGSALDFNGSGAYVTVGDADSLDTRSFTAAAWVKPNDSSTTATYGDPVIQRESGLAGWQMTWDSSGKFMVMISDGVTPNMLSGSSGKSLNTWYYVTVTYDHATTTTKIYVNGVQENSSSSYTLSPKDTGSFSIGTWGGTRNFKGSIDDLKLYNYARSAKQVVSDMNAGHPAVGSPVGSAIGYWDFDEGYGSTAYNLGNTGAANNETLTCTGVGCVNPSWTQNGKFGKALIFNGSNDLSKSGSTILPSGALTVSAWIQIGSTGTNYMITNRGDSSAVVGYAYFLYSGSTSKLGIWGVSPNAGMYSNAISVEDSSWHHVAVSASISAYPKFYLDGKDVTPTAGTNNLYTENTVAAVTSYPFEIGGRTRLSVINEGLVGLMDEVKVYNYALTADEIKLEYNRGSSMVLGALSDTSGIAGGVVASSSASAEYCVPGDTSTCTSPITRWDFEERSGTSANDTSGNGRTGTITNATWVSGKVGSALNFDGNGDYVGAGDILDSVTAGADKKFSMEVWVKPGVNNMTNNLIIAKSADSNCSLNQREYVLNLYTGSKPQFFWTSLDGTAYRGVLGSTAITDTTKWYHIAFSYDGSIDTNDGLDRVNIYVDGKKESTSLSLNAGTLAGSDIQDGTAHLGFAKHLDTSGSNCGTNSYFTGKLDQIRIFDYIRTQAQIAWDYNRGGPVGYWDLDECQGTTAYDQSGNSNNGTLTATSTVGTCTTASTFWGGTAGTGAGKRNYAPTFNGTGDYISLSSDPLGTNYTDYTISAWVKTSYSGNWQIIFQRANTGNDTSVASQFKINTSGQLAADDYNPSGGGFTGTSTAVNNGNWHHVVFSRSGSTRYFYIDSNLDNTQTSAESYSGSTPNAAYIGIDKRNTTAQQYFNGQIDDVKVYNYALTASQVRNLYGNGAVNFSPSTGAP